MTWVDTRLGALATTRVSNVDKHSVEGERPVRLCNYTDVYYNDAIRDSLPFMQATASPTQVERFRLHPGDVLITKDSETADDIGIPALVESAGEDLICGYHLAMLRPKTAVVPKYLYWSLTASHVAAQWEVMATGVTRVGLKASDLKTVRLRTPPTVNEQQAIADFLDRETAKIDALIEKQNEMIGLLCERRNTLILRYVTGVHRDENRRVVRIGWVNSIPVSWTSQRIDYLASVTLGKMVTPAPPNEQYVSAPYLRAANVQPNGATAFRDLQEMWFSPSELDNLTVHAGDVVVVEGGQGGFGRAAYVDVDLPGVGFQNSINRLRPTTCEGRFLTYALLAVRNTGFLHAYCDTVSMPHLTSEKLAGLRIAVPPLAEQFEIADRLDLETAKIDALIAKAEEFVALAKERRAALITAAVTGQIDVMREAS